VAKGLKREYRYLSIRLQFEKQHLWNWGSATGLLNHLRSPQDAILPEGIGGTNRYFYLEIVYGIQVLATDFIQSLGRFQEFCSQRDEPQDRLLPCLSQRLLDSKADLESSERLNRMLEGLAISQQLPKRMRWVVWNQAQFEALINRIEELNDHLANLTDEFTREQILEISRKSDFEFLMRCNEVEELAHLCVALARERPPGPLSQHLQIRRDEFLKLARFKALKKFIKTDLREPIIAEGLRFTLPSQQNNFLEIDRSDIQLLEQHPESPLFSQRARDSALYQNQTVWIEWKTHPASSAHAMPPPSLLRSIENLAILLSDRHTPTALRLPQCLGYFADVTSSRLASSRTQSQPFHRFGLILSHPPSSRPAPPTSLSTLLAHSPPPPLNARIALALALATSTHHCHLLHLPQCALDPHNVLFFSTIAGGIEMTCPYLVGQDIVDQGEKSESDSDIFALGLLFLAIAEWKPLEDVLGIEDLGRSSPGMVRGMVEVLLGDREFVDGVAANAGDMFAECVRSCIFRCDRTGLDVDGVLDERVDDALEKQLYINVVRRLKNTRC
jgi:hypothetical protein